MVLLILHSLSPVHKKKVIAIVKKLVSNDIMVDTALTSIIQNHCDSLKEYVLEFLIDHF